MREFKNKRNPILPLEYHIPDSEAHVMPDGRVYIYGSYDDRDNEYCSDKYYVVSSQDMEHWILHDESFNGKSVSWFDDPVAPRYPGLDWTHPSPFLQKMLANMENKNNEIENMEVRSIENKEPILYAPDCIEKDGKYYLYFCMKDEREGVAVGGSPEGPFKDPIQLPCGGIDPAVFHDDDGQVYYYWGQVKSYGIRMHPNMVSFSQEEPAELLTEEEHFFHEGSSVRKIGDIYYYVFADIERGKPTSLGYATGKSPLGPFTYRGIIIDNADCDPASWNIHGSIECVNDQWYVFYHRCSRGKEFYRRLCIEPIFINPDGSISEVKMTSQGAGEPFAPGESIYGYQACGLKGTAYIDTDEKYGEKLTCISDGDEAVFRYVKSKTKYIGIEICASGTGTIEILMDEKRAGVIGIAEGKQEDFQINMPAGEYEMKLKFLKSKDLEVKALTLKAKKE